MEPAQWLWTALIVINMLGSGVTAWAVLTNRSAKTQIEGDVNVKQASDYVSRPSYESHCRINREEHARIEREHKASVEKIEELHHKLSREVGEINARGELNEGRLIEIDRKLDNIRFGGARK